MRNLITIIFIFLASNLFAQTPTANAGSDITIYLTNTDSVTLTGTATNRSTSLWREISTDYSSGATIVSPSSLTTKVGKLPQGVFYFELDVASGTDIHAEDTIKVVVNYAPAPGILMRSMAKSAYPNIAFINTVNDRTGDTLNTLDQEVYPVNFDDGLGTEVFFDRDRKNDQYIDAQHGKFYSIIEDGYDWNNQGYNRSEMSFGSGYNFDTTKTYCMEWKGYFKNNFSGIKLNQTVAVFMQIHANSDAQHVFGTQINNDGTGTKFVIDADGALHTICGVDSFVNKTHTVRVTFKEGTPNAFYKVEVDGVQRYYNNTSIIGGLPRGQDYPKIATYYDYGNALVDPTNTTRGRKDSLVTEDFNIYDVSTPIVNAGADKTIYLTQTNSATLDGSASSADTYQWTEVSTDYSSGATISNSTSKIATVSGLPQGVFYFQLAATTAAVTKYDTMKVTVNYTTAPANSTLLFNFPLSDQNVLNIVNNRSDTLGYYPPSNPLGQVTDLNNHKWYLFRDRLNGLKIDAQRGKLISTIEDGYAHETSDGVTYYSRSEIALADGNFLIDTSKIYTFEWKGYLPSDTNFINTNGAPNWATILMMFQIHSLSQTPTVFGMNQGVKGNVYAAFQTPDSLTLGYIPDFTHARTLRFTIKEGKGQGAFMKVQLDGQTVFYEKNMQIGSGYYDDYVKFGGLYDWRRWVVNPDSLARGRKYSLVTEGFNVYQLADTGTVVAAPTISMSPSQTITIDSTAVGAVATWASGHSGTYLWTQVSGPNKAEITSSLSAQSWVKHLIPGTYVFRCTIIQDDGQTATGTVIVVVNTPIVAPTANAGTDKTITLPTTSVLLSGSATHDSRTTVTYFWTKVSGSGTQTIANNTTLSPTISGLTTAGSYVFNLKVSQSDGQTANDQVTIIVNAGAAPTIYAGNNQTIPGTSTTTTLTATYTIASGYTGIFNWVEESGPTTATIGTPTSYTTTIGNLSPGQYRFGCTLVQSDGQTAYDYVLVYVTAHPTANAGTDKTIALPTISVSLSGSATNDPSTTATYLWTKISGSGTQSISGSTTLTPTISGLTTVGSYVFNLKVTQSDGQVANDQMTITVTMAGAPTVTVGSNQTITISSTTVSSTGTAQAGHTITYLWTDISSGGTATIVSPTSQNTLINGLSVGTHTFQIKVTQDDGQTATATMTVTVTAPPTINAGASQTYPFGTTFTLTATYTLAPGTTGTFHWVNETDGTGTFSNQNGSTTTVSGLAAGTFRFGCTITQSDGQTAYSYVIITISAPLSSGTQLYITKGHKKRIFAP